MSQFGVGGGENRLCSQDYMGDLLQSALSSALIFLSISEWQTLIVVEGKKPTGKILIVGLGKETQLSMGMSHGLESFSSFFIRVSHPLDSNGWLRYNDS